MAKSCNQNVQNIRNLLKETPSCGVQAIFGSLDIFAKSTTSGLALIKIIIRMVVLMLPVEE